MNAEPNGTLERIIKECEDEAARHDEAATGLLPNRAGEARAREHRTVADIHRRHARELRELRAALRPAPEATKAYDELRNVVLSRVAAEKRGVWTHASVLALAEAHAQDSEDADRQQYGASLRLAEGPEPATSNPKSPAAAPGAHEQLRAANGVALIAAERERQVTAEGWTTEHDDTHDRAEMVGAAMNYSDFARFQIKTGRNDGQGFFHRMPPLLEKWPKAWSETWWKPSDDPIRNLVKAGALIAAEIDRLMRQATSPASQEPSE